MTFEEWYLQQQGVKSFEEAFKNDMTIFRTGGPANSMLCSVMKNAWNAALEHAPRPEAMPHEDPVRQAVKRHVRATAAHIKENAEALKKYDWEGNEARCRELCAMYLEEIALSMDMGDKLSALSKRLGMNSGSIK